MWGALSGGAYEAAPRLTCVSSSLCFQFRAGAEKALQAGRSLLAVGVVAVEGSFERGDAVTVRSREGRDLARGLVAYGSDEARRILGRRSEDIEQLLGYRGRDELIHRDFAVLNG